MSLLRYNLITREVDNPQVVNGYAFYDDGRLVVFRSDPEPTRTHAMQVWNTPFVSEEFARNQAPPAESFLAKVGNRDLVRGISDLLYISRLIANQKPSMQVYRDLLTTIGRVRDVHHWLQNDEACGVADILLTIAGTADTVIDEFDKVRQLTEQAAAQVATLEGEFKAVLREVSIGGRETVDEHVELLRQLRAKRGQIDTARSIRYVNLNALDDMDTKAAEAMEDLGQSCVEFLLRPESLMPIANL